ncbi:MAG: hypothetical protein A2Y38_15490 [Spirochaetes bacterium GWB1_59_5]|nr:MAG: hypothetical protein A2Y38_15490 [Spirochaetes bacterium GWB1_59_5]
MSRTHFQFKSPEELTVQIRAYGDRHGLKGDTAVMLHLVTAFFSVGNHAEFSKAERLPKTPKRKAEWKPLSAHTRARLTVLRSFGVHSQLTSSDISHYISDYGRYLWPPQSVNNVSKRLQELHQEGYIQATTEYRKSRHSGKRLQVWKRTDKPLPEGL